MPLDAFATAGMIADVDSEVLGDRVVFVSDNVRETQIGTDCPVYRAHELAVLHALQPSPTHLRAIHAVKTLFGGTITDTPQSAASPDD